MAIPAAVAGDVPGAAAPDDPGEDIRAALSVRRASSKGAIQPSRPRSTLALSPWHSTTRAGLSYGLVGGSRGGGVQLTLR